MLTMPDENKRFLGNSLILSKLSFLSSMKSLASSGRKGVTDVFSPLVAELHCVSLVHIPIPLATRYCVGYELAKCPSIQRGSCNMHLELLPMLSNRS